VEDLKNIHLKRKLENRHIQFISLGGAELAALLLQLDLPLF
jgi:L-asparagine transporter-like permease